MTGAIEILDARGARVVGKVIVCPARFPFPGEIQGRVIFYRPVAYQDAYSHKTDTLGVDVEAWLWAIKQGAEWQVISCRQGGQDMLYITHASNVNKSAQLDLGDYAQYRVPMRLWLRVVCASKPLTCWVAVRMRLDRRPSDKAVDILGQMELAI